MSAIILFYLLFPLLVRVVRRYPLGTLLLTYSVAILLLSVFPKMPWYYDCIVSRLSVFELGIICYSFHSDVRVMSRSFIVSTFVWCLSISYDLSRFLDTSAFCPILILCLYTFHKTFTETYAKKDKILMFVGLYSYEIYISNYSVAETLLYLFRLGYMRHLWEIVFSYIVLSFIYGFIWIMISRIINNRLINRKK